MGPPKPLYRVRVSSSGLIYAVIVGAWAAYLVPMWLRRQDELNEARPTERFSTAIRLLSGKAGMERRYAKDAERRETEVPDAEEDFAIDGSVPGGDDAEGSEPDTALNAVDVRAFADPKTMVGTANAETATDILPTPDAASARTGAEAVDGSRRVRRPSSSAGGAAGGTPAARSAGRDDVRRKTKRAKVLARRRRTTMVLFLAFTLGTVVAAVGGLAFLWAPAVPGGLLSAYIVYLRVQERRRFAAVMDRRRAAAAAQRLRECRGRRPAAGDEGEHAEGVDDEPAPFPAPPEERPGAADRRALVERTDHAEWVDQQRGRDREQAAGEGWDPVPVPLPTYVSAPVAPRSTRGVDLEAPDAWSSARSSTADAERGETRRPSSGEHSTGTRSRGREQGRTPLFDQYDGEERPRAANE